MDKKVKNTLAGLLFLVCAGYHLYYFVGLLLSRSSLRRWIHVSFMGLTPKFVMIGGVVGLAALALSIVAFLGKKRSKALDILGLVYVLSSGFMLAAANWPSFRPKGIKWIYYMMLSNGTLWVVVLLVVFFVGYFLAKSGDPKSSTKDTTSHAAQEKAQTRTQESIYDQQLREGILTQDEYDQITGVK